MKPIYILTRRDGTVHRLFKSKQELIEYMSVVSVSLKTCAIYEAYEVVPKVKVSIERMNDNDETVLVKQGA